MNESGPRQEKTPIPCANGACGISRDLPILLLWTLVSAACICFPSISPPPLRLILTLPLILFIPGYLAIGIVFPDPGSIDRAIRFTLAIATSVIITPVIGICLYVTALGIRWEPLILSLTALIIFLAIIVMILRLRTYAASSHTLSLTEIIQKCGGECRIRDDWKSGKKYWLMSLVIISAVILAAILVITLPQDDEQFTEFYLLGKNGTADDYPVIVIPKTPYPLYLGIKNHEFRQVNYSVRVYLTRIAEQGIMGTASSPPPLLVGTYSVSLGHTQGTVIPFDLIVPDTQYSRVDFLLDDEAAMPRGSTASLTGKNTSYRDLHVIFNVTPS